MGQTLFAIALPIPADLNELKNNLLRYTECIKRVLPTEKRPDRPGITCEREGMMARLMER